MVEAADSITVASADEESDPAEALREACEAAGGQSALARRLGLKSQGSISDWLATRIPAERVLSVESATGVSRHRLRPDLYPLDAATPSTVASRNRA